MHDTQSAVAREELLVSDEAFLARRLLCEFRLAAQLHRGGRLLSLIEDRDAERCCGSRQPCGVGGRLDQMIKDEADEILHAAPRVIEQRGHHLRLAGVAEEVQIVGTPGADWVNHPRLGEQRSHRDDRSLTLSGDEQQFASAKHFPPCRLPSPSEENHVARASRHQRVPVRAAQARISEAGQADDLDRAHPSPANGPSPAMMLA